MTNIHTSSSLFETTLLQVWGGEDTELTRVYNSRNITAEKGGE
jgi:hypothetical protein